MVTGAVALAEFAHVVAQKYPIHIALHTDHCQKDKLDSYVRPLMALSQQRVDRGENPLFQSHMWDGSAIGLEENLQIAAELLEKASKAHIILEVEIGVVGGEEDGVVGEMNEKLYTTPADALRTAEMLGTGEKGRYLLAATFGNVHGVYKPGNVKLRPDILKEIQDAVGEKVGQPRPFDLVFHGGSGSALEEIREAVSYGVVKMNVDTDTQYAFTRPIAGHMFTNYDGVLKVDGEVGNKKAYDPRSYLKTAEVGMAARVGNGLRGPTLRRDGRERLTSIGDVFAPPEHKYVPDRGPEPLDQDRHLLLGHRLDCGCLAATRRAEAEERGHAAGGDQHGRDQQAELVAGQERVDRCVAGPQRRALAGGQDRADHGDAEQPDNLARRH